MKKYGIYGGQTSRDWCQEKVPVPSTYTFGLYLSTTWRRYGSLITMAQAIGLPRPSQRAANRSLSDILSFSGDIRYFLGRALAAETEYKMWVESLFFARGLYSFMHCRHSWVIEDFSQ